MPPSVPPASAFAAARKRTQAGLEALHPATIAIDGTGYAGAAWIGAEEPKLAADGGGWSYIQRFQASILKTVLATRPAKTAKVVISGLTFDVMTIGGDNASDECWTLEGMRVVPKP